MENTIKISEKQSLLAKCVGPEDLARGDFVAVSRFATEYATFMWDDIDFSLPRESTIQVWWTGGCASIAPYKVQDVCLPFLLVRSFDRKWLEIDVRQLQLMKLDPKFAKRVRKKLRAQAKMIAMNKPSC